METLLIGPESDHALGRALDISYPRPFTLPGDGGTTVQCASIGSATIAHLAPHPELQAHFAKRDFHHLMHTLGNDYLTSWRKSKGKRLHWAGHKVQRFTEDWQVRLDLIFRTALEQNQELQHNLQESAPYLFRSNWLVHDTSQTLLTASEFTTRLYWLRELACA